MNKKDYDGEIPIALDCWTSPNHRAWMSIATSRVRRRDDGTEETVTHLLDFVELPHSHSGENMAEALRKVLIDYGVEHKVSIYVQ